MEKRNLQLEYNPWILQDLVHKIHDLQQRLEQIAEDTHLFLSRVARYQFEYQFDERTGLVRDITYDPALDFDDDRIWQMHKDYKQFCLQDAEAVQSNLREFYRSREGILKILDGLARPVQERLSDLRKHKHWVTLVVRYCMVPVVRWPTLPSRSRWVPSGIKYQRWPEIPKRFDRMLELFTEVDPTEHWQKICQRFDSIVDDIVAVAWSFGSEISREADGPCDHCTWRHKGKVIDDKMERRAWLLANLLFHRQPSPVEFVDLAEPVFSEREDLVDYNMVSNPRTDANNFFLKHSIPWEIGTEGKRKVFLRHLSEEELLRKKEKNLARS